MHYKSFKELYSIQILENHRLLFVNAKAKVKKSKIKITKTKHTMSFYFFTIYVKNVSIIVNCIECKKLHLLFNAKKLFEKNKIII